MRKYLEEISIKPAIRQRLNPVEKYYSSDSKLVDFVV